MIQLLVNLVEFDPHFAQRGDEFLPGVPGPLVCHENMKVRSLKRLVLNRFGNHRSAFHGHGQLRLARNPKSQLGYIICECPRFSVFTWIRFIESRDRGDVLSWSGN